MQVYFGVYMKTPLKEMSTKIYLSGKTKNQNSTSEPRPVSALHYHLTKISHILEENANADN